MTHSTIVEIRGNDIFNYIFKEEITTLFCVATAPLGPDVQRVIWKEVRDDQILRYTKWTLFDINYFISEFMICQREYPDIYTFDDGSFTPSTVNMVTDWVEFLEKRAAREIRPSITIQDDYGWVVSAEKEDLWIIILKSELRIKDSSLDIDHIVEIDRHCDALRRLQELPTTGRVF
jgi:hypothetical protein